jgi:conjugative relaxase-like TrwC/TraI family protein
MMSLHRLSGGAGYQYLLRHTACGDARRAISDSLVDYYSRTGYPPGRWLGRGLAGLSMDSPTSISPGEVVSEDQLALLFGAGRHPVTGQHLGLAPRADTSRRVSGFDLTFTVPKSASVLWGLGDEPTRQAVADAHRAAVSDLLGWIEDRALFTRTGRNGVNQVATRGMLAAGFDHWDTRLGDPNLHTHVIIANRVQGPDGQWRAIDGRTLYLAAVAVSEMYDDVFADRLAARLPVRWGFRSRGANRTPAHEITGLSDELLAAFSTRSTSIAGELASLTARFRADNGRAPTRTEIVKLRQQATLATRPVKTAQPLGHLLTRWAATARRVTGLQPWQVTAEALSADPAQRVRAEQISTETVHRLAGMVADGLVDRRAVFTEWNIWAETARATRGLRMASLTERTQLLERVVAGVKAICVPLDLPALDAPEAGRGADTGMRIRAGEARFAHPELVAAEEHLVAAHADASAPALKAATVETGLHFRAPVRPQPALADGLSPDQITAVRHVATSGRRVDVLVGPAGSGKTTTLSVLATLWQRVHGDDSVIGLAPSATAAHQLSSALGIPTENTAKWLHETTGNGATRRAATITALRERRGNAIAAGDPAEVRRISATITALFADQQSWQLQPRQLLIVDEATLAGTLDLSRLVTQAENAGAKVLLVGDHAQLGAVTAGGGFGMLARTGTPAQLHSLWRFTSGWEAAASRSLRTGDPVAIEHYLAHGRLHAGPPEKMLDAAYTAWATDREARRNSILVAPDTATVSALNDRAHSEAVTRGTVTGSMLALGGSCGPDRGQVGAGDTIVTRRNDRTLRLPDGQHVRNGTLWTVTATHDDGSLTAAPLGGGATRDACDPGLSIRLPAAYVTEHVDLGYAITAHRAQGITVDTSHTLASPATSREAFYVAMTRGRDANHTYLISDPAGEDGCGPATTPLAPDPTPLMAAILANTQAELSATETLRAARAATPDAELDAAISARLAARTSVGVMDLGPAPDGIATSPSGPNRAPMTDAHVPLGSHHRHVQRETALSIADG